MYITSFVGIKTIILLRNSFVNSVLLRRLCPASLVPRFLGTML